MLSPAFTKSFLAGAAVRGRRFVVIGAADATVIEATGAAATILGVSEQVDAASGDTQDVVMGGTAEIVYGAAVTRGQRLTADGAGAAIPAAPAAGANAAIGAIALYSGAAGDIRPVLVTPHIMQG